MGGNVITDTNELLRLYPTMYHPIRCENGCGAVIDLAEAFDSYKRHVKYNEVMPLQICECCAAEEGHLNEDIEEPDTAPVCRRKSKTRI